MKAVVLDRPGSPDILRISDVDIPVPGNGEVRVKVHAVGLNPVDYKLAEYGYPTWRFPFVLGLDVAGTIDELGPDVSGWKVGDQVFYHGDLSKPGGFADYAVTAAHTMVPLPKGLSFVDAAGLPCAGFTAYHALFDKLHIQENQTILIHGGAGGVGGFGVQLAAMSGLEVISTCSDHNADYVKTLGARHVINYATQDVPAMVRKFTKEKGVDAVVDTISSQSATAGLGMLAFGGGIACIAGLPDISKIVPFTKAFSVHEIALGAVYLWGGKKRQEQLVRYGKALGSLASEKKIQTMVGEVISMEEIPDGLMRLSKRHVRGKIVAQIVP